ncbi:MAG: prepilin-type N-terminal cleavage/methylation domain-containing protein [Oribacterium sp.]|nr:prepilin-type N-terminal cleavage/methylation domain-containing protein [Oribacterium sp.]
MFKKLNKKGFTLAELLVVVAIIGVLVAISIPIFTSQLEKAREATDEANIRAIYAECSADVLTQTEDGNNDKTANEGRVEWTVDAKGVVTATGTYTMKQQEAGLAGNTSGSIDIGGVKIASADFKTGTATITVKGDGTKPSITIA